MGRTELFILLHFKRIYFFLINFHFRQITSERESGQDVTAPKHGKTDPRNAPHVGGNTWAGGTGGRDTAGLGGKGGPYRLDSGHDVTQVTSRYNFEILFNFSF